MSSVPSVGVKEYGWILESLERIDHVLLRRNGRAGVLDELLELMLEIFGCSRAWLALPEPTAGVTHLRHHRTVPEFPFGVLAEHGAPYDEGARAIIAAMAQAAGSVTFGEGNEEPMPQVAIERAQIHSQVAMGLQPTGESAWIFGLHHCHGPRTWTPAERWLFEAIGRRVSDALERLRVADQLNKYSSVVEAMVDPLMITDVVGEVRYVNRALTTVTGHAAEDMIGRSVYDALITEPTREHVRAGGTMLPGGGLLPPSGEYLARHADGTLHPYIVTFSLLPEEAGEPREVIAIARSVAAEKRAERAHHELSEQLRQSQKMEAIGRLAGGVAHDFNNLITAIIGYAEMGLGDLPEEHPFHPDLGEIMGAAERAATLTSQLLAFSRKQVVSLHVVDLNQVVTGARRMLERLIGEDINLVCRLADDLWRVRCDVNQIDQVLINLAINARDAMPGGGELQISTENIVRDRTIVDDGAVREGRRELVQVTVSDNGEGIDEDTRQRIFEPFFSTKPKDIGTGLGLSTVYGIVKQAGGTIDVSSTPGEGTRFRVCLPRVTAEAAESKSAEEEEPPRGAETILLVEDEDSVRRLALRILKSLGYEVLEACDGPTALSLVAGREGKIDLLVTDVIMPGLNGRQLYERLQDIRPGLKVLYISGYAEEVVTVHGVLDPGIAFLPKPFSLLGLARKVREALASESPPEGE